MMYITRHPEYGISVARGEGLKCGLGLLEIERPLRDGGTVV